MKDAGLPTLEESVDPNDASDAQPDSLPQRDFAPQESWRLPDEASRLPHAATAPPRRSWLTARVVVSALAVLALGQAAFIAGRLTAPAAAPPVVSAVPVLISSTGVGDIVAVDGREVGATPVRLSVDGTVHEIHLISPPPVQLPPPVVTSTPPVPVDALTPSRPRSGGLTLSSPIEIQVLEGERVLGSSVDGPIVTTAGVHQLDFVNSALGYRERRSVEFRAGQVVTLTVTPPNGRLNINAVPWAQVSIDGREVGETPLANVSVTAGQHQIVFRHPQLGERRETTVVKSGAVTRLSVAMSQ